MLQTQLSPKLVVSMFCQLVILSKNTLEIVAVKQLNSRRLNLISNVSTKSSKRFFRILLIEVLLLSRVLRTIERSQYRSRLYLVRIRTQEILDQILRRYQCCLVVNIYVLVVSPLIVEVVREGRGQKQHYDYKVRLQLRTPKL